MKIAIVGAGALGSLFGGYLSLQHEVTCIVRRLEHANQINENGIRIIDGKKEILTRPFATLDSASIGPVDMVIVCVKATQTLEAMQSHKCLVGEKTLILSLQNGFGNHEDLRYLFSEKQIVMGITSNGANITSTGVVLYAGHGETKIGGLLEDQENAKLAAEVLRGSGFPTTVSQNIMDDIWKKLLINVGINPIAALCRAPNRYIIENPGANKASRLLVSEAVDIARVYGVNVKREEMIAAVEQVAKATGDNLCSMLQDIRNKRPTEINKINGAIVTLAKQIGRSAPLNQKIVDLILQQ